MKVLFDKKFLYNWTVNPDRPGLADFLVFSLKYACIALLVYSLQIDRWLEFTVAILAPLLEEQARVTWMHNAKSPLRAGMIFAVLLAAAELLELGRISGGFATLSGFSELIAVRSVPSLYMCWIRCSSTSCCGERSTSSPSGWACPLPTFSTTNCLLKRLRSS